MFKKHLIFLIIEEQFYIGNETVRGVIMVFPSIRSFQEISLINVQPINKISKEIHNRYIQNSGTLSQPSKYVSNHSSRKMRLRNNFKSDFPIAS